MKLPFFGHSQYRAFTLIEMLVVASIVIILSIIVVVNYELGGYQFSLNRSAHQLAQSFRKASEMSMSAREFGGSVPSGGYGIYINWAQASPPAPIPPSSKSYIIFADFNNNAAFDPGLGEQVEIIELEEYVEIFQTCVDTLCVTALPVTFVPPDPVVKFDGMSAASYLTVELKSRKVEGITTVYINKAGLIEIHQ